MFLHDNATVGTDKTSAGQSVVLHSRRHYTTAVDLDFDLTNHIVRTTYAVNVTTFAKDATVAAKNAPADQTKLAIRLTTGDAKQAAKQTVQNP